jgi:hypothetical protein
MRAADLFEQGVIPAEIAREEASRIRSFLTGAPRCDEMVCVAQGELGGSQSGAATNRCVLPPSPRLVHPSVGPGDRSQPIRTVAEAARFDNILCQFVG